MDPQSPLDSEENTPTQSRHNTPSPPRSFVPQPKEYSTIPPPNSTVNGIPKNWERRAEELINMGFGFAHSWIGTIKPSRFNVAERISLPRIFYHVPQKNIDLPCCS